MNVLSTLGVILLLAFIIEAMVEYIFGQLVAHTPKLQPFAWTLMYVALLIGVAGAFIYKFDLIFLIGSWLNAPVPSHWFGVALTGLAIGRGSNFIHDIIKRFFASDQPKVIVGLVDTPKPPYTTGSNPADNDPLP